jgi:hypothetical protein
MLRAGGDDQEMIRKGQVQNIKGQVRNIGGRDISAQAEFIAGLVQVAA